MQDDVKQHELKIDTSYFNDILSGKVKYQIRDNSRREIKANDTILFKETKFTGDEMSVGHPLEYTGRECAFVVTDVCDSYGLQRGHIIFHIEKVKAVKEVKEKK